MTPKEQSPNAFAGAFTESAFERMKDSQHVTVIDWHGMGPMSEFDYHVSFTLPTTAVDEDQNGK